MRASPCCRGRQGAHYGWCPTLIPIPGPQPAAPPRVGTAHLGHFQAPPSGLMVTGVPVLEVTSAVLCPACLGDWCEACDWSGMAQPVRPRTAVILPFPVHRMEAA